MSKLIEGQHENHVDGFSDYPLPGLPELPQGWSPVMTTGKGFIRGLLLDAMGAVFIAALFIGLLFIRYGLGL